MRVLFTHSYFLHFDIKQLNTQTPYPPLGTLYAAAVLRENGYEVRLADLQFSKDPTEIENHIRDFQPDIFVIYDDGFNYLTKMCLTNMREAAFKMQQIAKRSQLPVIVSSSDATDHLEKYFSNGANYIIIGEAEQTLLEICNAIKTKNETGNITGLATFQNNSILKNTARAVRKDLDELPPPAWDLVNITPYKNAWLKKHGYFSLNFVTTRGCPYKCNWCAKPIYGNRYNSHSPENVVKLIKDLQSKFGFTHVWFADDIFGLKPNWLKQFSENILKEKIKIRYKIQSRADLLLEDKSVEYLAASGCDMVWMGAESGSQKILDAMDKGITVEQIKKATYLLKKHHIKPALFLQFGYPGEDMSDIEKTIEMVHELLPEDIGVSVSYPLPGTGFYEKVRSELKNKSNWSHSDDLDLMFRNNYSPGFYKQLHRYIHQSYRSKQSLALWRETLSLKSSQHNMKSKKIALTPYYFINSLLQKKKLQKLFK